MCERTGLVVDDSREIRMVIVQMLKIMGISAVEAGNLREARQHLTERTFCFVITDYDLGDDNGLEVVDAAASLMVPPTIIMVSGSRDKFVPDEAKRRGAKAFLPKPFLLEDLSVLLNCRH